MAGVPVVVEHPVGDGVGTIVYAHGGAWSFGDPSDVEPAVAEQVERGWTVVSVDYQLGAGSLPVAVAQVSRVVRAVTRSIAYSSRPTRPVVLAGQSAGAHLAALATTSAARLDREMPSSLAAIPGRPDGLVAISGVYELVRWDQDLPLIGSSQELLARVIGKSSLLHPGRCSKATLRRWSPVTHVDRRTPPVYLAHGVSDPVTPPSQAEVLRRRVEAQGTPVTVSMQLAGHVLEPGPQRAPLAAFLDSLR
jgi:acetyl esterase/lipase